MISDRHDRLTARVLDDRSSSSRSFAPGSERGGNALRCALIPAYSFRSTPLPSRASTAADDREKRVASLGSTTVSRGDTAPAGSAPDGLDRTARSGAD